jgi:hypothetical protein
MVREKGFATVVRKGEECASACAMIWLSGAKRELRGRLGLHSARAEGEDIRRGALGNAMRAMGVSEAVARLPAEIDPTDMRWITADEAAELGLVHVPLPAPKPAARQTAVAAKRPVIEPVPGPLQLLRIVLAPLWSRA